MRILHKFILFFDISFKLSARKNENSIGKNIAIMEISILHGSPEYHINREREANTAVSSLAMTLPQASKGETMKEKRL